MHSCRHCLCKHRSNDASVASGDFPFETVHYLPSSSAYLLHFRGTRKAPSKLLPFKYVLDSERHRVSLGGFSLLGATFTRDGTHDSGYGRCTWDISCPRVGLAKGIFPAKFQVPTPSMTFSYRARSPSPRLYQVDTLSSTPQRQAIQSTSTLLRCFSISMLSFSLTARSLIYE